MKQNYIKRGMLLLGAAAMVGVAFADNEYVDITRQYIQDPTFVPGWQGVIGNVAEGVGEVWNGAFKTYQNLGEMPAGHYVLTANAFYRCGGRFFAKDNQVGNPELNTAYIFINDAQAPVVALTADGRDVVPDGEDVDWGQVAADIEAGKMAPNSMWDASVVFGKGQYVNTVEYDHPGGVMVIGIANSGCYHDEWCCFDNFKLTCDGAEVDAIINGDFNEGLDAKRAWDNFNTEGKEKTPDVQKDGSGGGDYRKCGGSPYNTAQQVELPAGTYRFSMTCFHRYGSTVDANGVYYNHKWPVAGPCDAYGSMGRTPKDWFEAGDYDEVGDERYAHAYIFMSMNEAKPRSLAWSESEAEGDLNEATDMRTRVRDCWEICNGDFATMPQNNTCHYVDEEAGVDNWFFADGSEIVYETKNKVTSANDSGCEREAAAAFYADPEKWRHSVEFTLEAPAKVWLGLGKDANSGDGYWHAYGYITLEKVIGDGIAAVDADDANAPVEYYNIQGMRVMQPTQGLYIVKQGNKVSKQVIR